MGTSFAIGSSSHSIVGSDRTSKSPVGSRLSRASVQIEGGPESRNRWCYSRDVEGNVFEIKEWVTPPANPMD
jgi:hypothetical protein